MSILKYLKMPHISYWKRRWVRRIMIVIALPQEIVRAIYSVFWHAVYWWKWTDQ